MLSDKHHTTSSGDATLSKGPAGWSELEVVLREMQASELLVVSDMTGTLITQTPDSMLPEMRAAIRSLTERGAAVMLATADSGHSVEQFFLRPLAAREVSNLYVVHSVGAWRGRVINGDLEVLSQGRDLSFEDRRQLLRAMDRALCSVLNRSTSIFDGDAHQEELLNSGARMSLHALSEHFGAQSFLEIIPSKAAIFFLEEKIAGAVQQQIFDAYLSDPRVADVLKVGGYQLIRGGNYVDIFTCTKEEGVRELLPSIKLPQKRSLVVLGDSENDMGLLKEHYEGFERVLRIFVGQSTSVVDGMMQSPMRHEFFHLPARHCEGSAAVLGAITR